MSFSDEVLKTDLIINIVIDIGGRYFSRYRVDSGLLVALEDRIVDTLSTGKFSVDLRTVKTSIPSTSFELLDKDYVFTNYMALVPNRFLESEVKIYMGFITGAYSWIDYKMIFSGTIKSITRKDNGYKVDCRPHTAKLISPFLSNSASLLTAMTNVQTYVEVDVLSLFPTSGMIKVDDELMTYTGKDVPAKRLTGVTRASQGSIADAHSDGAEVYFVYKIRGNPIDVMLKLMVSPSGGSTYAVLPYGLNISSTSIDFASFEAIRDINFPAVEFEFLLYDIESLMEYFENEILLPLNCRFIEDIGKISAVYIAENLTTKEINDDSTIDIPAWSIIADRITNRIIIKWDYDDANDIFKRTSVIENADSITTYGLKEYNYEFEAIRETIDGENVINELASKLIFRLKDPRQKINIKVFLKDIENKIGGTIKLKNNFVPGNFGMGIEANMNILEKGVDYNSGVVEYGLYFTVTESAGIERFGFIAPAKQIASITSQHEFTVSNGTWYEVGFSIKIGTENRKITVKSGNVLTVASDFTTPLVVGSRVKISDYSLVGPTEKNYFVFVSPLGDANFPDGEPPYQLQP